MLIYRQQNVESYPSDEKSSIWARTDVKICLSMVHIPQAEKL